MAGKFLVAVVAAAVSSASAATVGVVYTRVAATHHAEAPAAAASTGAGLVKSAVVLNASSESLFESFAADSSGADADSSACIGGSDSQRCAAPPRASDVRLNILGSTPTLLPIWLGGDSEDQYSANAAPIALPVFAPPPPIEVVVRLSRRAALSSGFSLEPQSDEDGPARSESQSESGSQGGSAPQTNGDSTALTSLSLGIDAISVGVAPRPTIENNLSSDALPDVVPPPADLPPLADVPPVVPPLSVFSPIDSAPRSTEPSNAAGPTPSWSPLVDPGAQSPFTSPVGRNAGAVPEPSTWAMMIAGAAAIWVVKRRRVAAALKSAWS